MGKAKRKPSLEGYAERQTAVRQASKELHAIIETKDHPSVEHNECSVCFEPLCKKQLCVLVGNDGKRVCPHFVHSQCAWEWLVHGVGEPSCPICRTPCASATYPKRSGILDLPDFMQDPRGFFFSLDTNNDQSLDKQESMHALKAVMPIDSDGRWLSQNFDRLWTMWDINGDNQVSMEEFMTPGTGLLSFAMANCPTKAMRMQICPDFATQPMEWFTYWDEDHSLQLDMHEVCRGMIKSYDLHWDPESMKKVREMLISVWTFFDFDGDGTISENEFLMRDGLWEMMIAHGAARLLSTRSATASAPDMDPKARRGRGPNYDCKYCQPCLPNYMPEPPCVGPRMSCGHADKPVPPPPTIQYAQQQLKLRSHDRTVARTLYRHDSGPCLHSARSSGSDGSGRRKWETQRRVSSLPSLPQLRANRLTGTGTPSGYANAERPDWILSFTV